MGRQRFGLVRDGEEGKYANKVSKVKERLRKREIERCQFGGCELTVRTRRECEAEK